MDSGRRRRRARFFGLVRSRFGCRFGLGFDVLSDSTAGAISSDAATPATADHARSFRMKIDMTKSFAAVELR